MPGLRGAVLASAVLTLAVLQAGCSGNALPENNPRVERDFGGWAGEYGCSQPNAGSAVVMATNTRIQKGPRYKPEVGWDACELMFALGYPSKEDSQDTENGQYRSWWVSRVQRRPSDHPHISTGGGEYYSGFPTSPGAHRPSARR
jgi:hypothetical protein